MTVTVGRTLAIVRQVAVYGPISVDAIAAETGIPVSTVYRYVGTMIRLGYLTIETHGRYVVGPLTVGMIGHATEQTRANRVSAVRRVLLRALPLAPTGPLNALAAQIIDAIGGVHGGQRP